MNSEIRVTLHALMRYALALQAVVLYFFQVFPPTLFKPAVINGVSKVLGLVSQGALLAALAVVIVDLASHFGKRAG